MEKKAKLKGASCEWMEKKQKLRKIAIWLQKHGYENKGVAS